jgi:hypothetical protein
VREATGNAERIGLVLAVAIPAGLLTLWATPRPAQPAEMPALVLPAPAVARAIADEDALAATAPEDDEDETLRRRLYLAEGRAEVRMNDSPDDYQTRRANLTMFVQRIAARDPHEVAAIRARDVTRMLPALRGEGGLNSDDRAAELGGFPALLARYGAIVNERRVAPEIVIRTMFHARWNTTHGLPLTDGMDTLHLRAYHGWLALEGGEAPLAMRIEALEPFAAAGGWRVWEARGALAFESGAFAEARGDYERAYELGGSVRLRNLALGAEAAEIAANE